MKNLYFILLALLFSATTMNAQTLEELQAKKDELAAKAAEAQATADALNGEISSLTDQIKILSGWRTGFAGNVGFDFGGSNNWVSSPNPTATSSGLGIGLSAFANKMTDKTMFRNKGIVNKAYRDIDQGIDEEADKDGLFDDENGVSDILNLSSLYGYRIHPKVALSALGELNTSVSNFLQPGALDIGVGATWTPNNDLVVVVHPFNYRVAWPADGSGVESSGALGMKLRADYGKTYNIAGKNFGVSSTFTTFLPYGDTETVFLEGTDDEYSAGLFEYTWLNTISFELFRGIGVGVGFGLRSADFEINDTVQNYYNVGLTYSL